MIHSKSSSTKSSKNKNSSSLSRLRSHPALSKLPYALVVLSFLGFLDAAYLTVSHYQNVAPPCSLAHGCETVLTSKYAMIGPVPLALIGLLYYVLMLVLSVLYMQGKRGLVERLVAFLTISGLAVSAVLVYLQASVIHAFCQYCLTSEGIILLLFICYFFLPKDKKNEE